MQQLATDYQGNEVTAQQPPSHPIPSRPYSQRGHRDPLTPWQDRDRSGSRCTPGRGRMGKGRRHCPFKQGWAASPSPSFPSLPHHSLLSLRGQFC